MANTNSKPKPKQPQSVTLLDLVPELTTIDQDDAIARLRAIGGGLDESTSYVWRIMRKVGRTFIANVPPSQFDPDEFAAAYGADSYLLMLVDSISTKYVGGGAVEFNVDRSHRGSPKLQREWLARFNKAAAEALSEVETAKPVAKPEPTLGERMMEMQLAMVTKQAENAEKFMMKLLELQRPQGSGGDELDRLIKLAQVTKTLGALNVAPQQTGLGTIKETMEFLDTMKAKFSGSGESSESSGGWIGMLAPLVLPLIDKLTANIGAPAPASGQRVTVEQPATLAGTGTAPPGPVDITSPGIPTSDINAPGPDAGRVQAFLAEFRTLARLILRSLDAERSIDGYIDPLTDLIADDEPTAIDDLVASPFGTLTARLIEAVPDLGKHKAKLEEFEKAVRAWVGPDNAKVGGA